MGFDRFFLSVACINPGCFGACPGLIWCLICRKTACSSTIAGLLAAVWLWLLALSAGLDLIDLPIAAAALSAFQRAGAGPAL